VFTGKVRLSSAGEAEWRRTMNASVCVLCAKQLMKLTPEIYFTKMFTSSFCANIISPKNYNAKL